MYIYLLYIYINIYTYHYSPFCGAPMSGFAGLFLALRSPTRATSPTNTTATPTPIPTPAIRMSTRGDDSLERAFSVEICAIIY